MPQTARVASGKMNGGDFMGSPRLTSNNKTIPKKSARDYETLNDLSKPKSKANGVIEVQDEISNAKTRKSMVVKSKRSLRESKSLAVRNKAILNAKQELA